MNSVVALRLLEELGGPSILDQATLRASVEAVQKVLPAYLMSQDVGERMDACELLAIASIPEALPLLGGLLYYDPVQEVRECVLRRIGWFGAAAIPIITPLLKFSNDDIRCSAVLALDDVRDALTSEYLHEMLMDQCVDVVAESVLALSRFEPAEPLMRSIALRCEPMFYEQLYAYVSESLLARREST